MFVNHKFENGKLIHNINDGDMKKIKSMHLIKNKDVTETFDTPFMNTKEAGIDTDNLIIKGVCLFGTRESKNGYTYTDKAIDSLKNLSDGLKCYINHPSKSEAKDRDGVRDLRDWAGVYYNPVKSGEKVFADLHCREAYFDLVKDIAALQPAGVGNSINARVKMFTGEDGKESVIDIDLLRSGDLVSSAATVNSLWESVGDKIEEEINKKPDIWFSGELIESKISDKFKIQMAEEGILQDKIDNEKIQSEIRQVTYLANDLISDILYKEMSIDDKKKKIMAVFDDLDKEVAKRLGNIKEESKKENLKEMDLTIEKLKTDHKELISELFESFKKEMEIEKNAEKLEAVRTELETSRADLEKANASVKEKDAKIKELEEKNSTLATKLDEIEVANKIAEKKELIEGLIQKAELPKEAISDLWKSNLMKIEEKKDGETVISVEEQINKEIEDRKSLLKLKKGKVMNSGDEFIEKKESKKESVTNQDIDEFVSKIS